MPRKHAPAATGRQPPELPPSLRAVEPPELLTDGMGFTRCTLLDADYADQAADDVLFEQVVCRQISLNGSQFTLAQLLDVRLDSCDLAGSDWQRAHMQRIELLGCRLVGMKLIDSEAEHALFQRCNGELARFWNSIIKTARFEHCTLREASFAGSDLSGAVFRHCDLRKADLRDAKLQGADFRGSNLEGVHIGVKDRHGAILEPGQLIHLADLLGITVKPDEAE
jgi:uncharacterized protein YjbI with pentapeptide repeats